MGIESSPEPFPDVAVVEWGVLWPLHYNLFGILFALLLIYTSVNLYLLKQKNRRSDRFRLFYIVNVLLICFSLISSLSLLIDPYASGQNIKTINFRGLLFLIINLRVTCVTAAFSLIEISILEALKIQLYSKRLQNFRFMISVVLIHVALTLVFSLYALLEKDSMKFLIICKVLYSLLGVLLCVSALHISIKVLFTYGKGKEKIASSDHLEKNYDSSTEEGKMQSTLARMQFRLRESLHNKNIRHLMAVLIANSVIGFIYWVAIVYDIASACLSRSDEKNLWKWYILQTIYRTNEAAMVSCMAFMVKYDKKRNRTKNFSTLR